MLPTLSLTAVLNRGHRDRLFWVIKDPNENITAFIPDDRWNGTLKWPVGGNPYHG